MYIKMVREDSYYIGKKLMLMIPYKETLSISDAYNDMIGPHLRK